MFEGDLLTEATAFHFMVEIIHASTRGSRTAGSAVGHFTESSGT
jgi:hypothetical protein